jgi:hypothetical protein
MFLQLWLGLSSHAGRCNHSVIQGEQLWATAQSVAQRVVAGGEGLSSLLLPSLILPELLP